MPRPSRARRILKWTGVGLSLLIISIWAASLWWQAVIVIPGNRVLVRIDCGTTTLGFTNGDIRLILSPSTGIERHGWDGLGFESPLVEWGHNFGNSIYGWGVLLPLWLLLLLTAIPTAWLWHRDRRLISCSPGHLLCIRCGYDLTGNTSGVCPECGDKVHPPAVLADSECGEPRAAGEVKGESGQESKTNHLFT